MATPDSDICLTGCCFRERAACADGFACCQHHTHRSGTVGAQKQSAHQCGASACACCGAGRAGGAVSRAAADWQQYDRRESGSREQNWLRNLESIHAIHSRRRRRNIVAADHGFWAYPQSCRECKAAGESAATKRPGHRAGHSACDRPGLLSAAGCAIASGRVAKATVKARDDVFQLTQALTQSKLKSELDRNVAAADLSQAQLLQLDAENSVASARSELSALLAAPPNVSYQATGSAEIAAAPPALSQALMDEAHAQRPTWRRHNCRLRLTGNSQKHRTSSVFQPSQRVPLAASRLCGRTACLSRTGTRRRA